MIEGMVQWIGSIGQIWSGLSQAEKVWLGLGLIAQGLFFSRFLVQWMASERAGRSVVPILFWYLSISGATLLLALGVPAAVGVWLVRPLQGFKRAAWFTGAEAEQKSPPQAWAGLGSANRASIRADPNPRRKRIRDIFVILLWRWAQVGTIGTRFSSTRSKPRASRRPSGAASRPDQRPRVEAVLAGGTSAPLRSPR